MELGLPKNAFDSPQVIILVSKAVRRRNLGFSNFGSSAGDPGETHFLISARKILK